jgi:hypothetical protein
VAADVRQAALNRGGYYHRTNSGQPKPQKKKIYHLLGGKSIDMPHPDTDINTIEHALYSRVFTLGGKEIPMPKNRKFVRQICCKFRKRMLRMQRRRECKEPLTRDEFIMRYKGKKRRIYERAKQQLEEGPVSLDKIARIKCFIKCEPIKKDPRLISTRDPMFHMEFGRHIAVIEEDVFSDVNHIFAVRRPFVDRLPTILKGLNQLDRGRVIEKKWSRFAEPVFVGLDVSRFDAHVSKYMLEVEEEVYSGRTVQNDSPFSFKQLMREIMVNRGRYVGDDGKITYRVEGTRASGDMNTSLGNCTVMCALLYSYLDAKNLLSKVEVIDDGDDAGIIIERKYLKELEDLEQFYYDMGFTLKIEEPVAEIEAIEFCRCHPVYTKKGYTMCPNPFRRLYTDTITDKPLQNSTTMKKWMGAVAGCGLATTAGLPVFQEFYKWLARSSDHLWIPGEGDFYWRYRDELAQGMKIQKRPVCLETRESFAKAYGLSAKMQLFFENMFKSQALLHYSSKEIRSFDHNFLQTDLPCSVTSVYESYIL